MLQRIVGTAALASGICLAAAGIASAASPVSGLADKAGDPLGAISSVDNVTGGSALKGLGAGDAGAVTGKVGSIANGLPAGKAVGDVTKDSNASSVTDLSGLGKTEALPLAGGLPAAGGLSQGLPTQGLPLVGDATGATGQLPVVGGLTGGQPAAPAKTKAKAPKAKTDTGKTEFGDQMAARSVGGHDFAVLPGDIAQRPTEDLPLVGNLPLVGGLGNTVPLGGLPLSGN